MINLTVVIDNDEALKKLRELQKVAKSTTSSVVEDSERIDAAWNRMKNTIGGIAAGYSFIELAKQVVNVRGEVQQLEVAFETMLGSKQKSDTLMKEMIDLAAKTPFGLQDVTNAAKQLLAFGSTAEHISEEITMLGDIAAGLSIPLGDLIYLYGTTRTQGRMFTQDLRQFMGRGIPLAEELAKQFGVTKDQVGELVTAGKVGFDDLQKALSAMTSEGGQFGGLMEKQSQTITGQISALQDAIYQMFNDIGESSEGIISDVISGASWIVEHYEPILKILSKVVIAWGAYKAALIAVAAVQKIKDAALLAKTLVNVAKGATTATQAFRALNTAMKSNPWGLLASVIATVIALIWDFCSATDEVTDGVENIERSIGKLEQAVQDEMTEVNSLVDKLKQANLQENERVSILNRLKDINPDIVAGIDAHSVSIDKLTQNLKTYNEEQQKVLVLSSLMDKKTSAFDEFIKAQADLVVYEEEVKDKIRTWSEEQREREYFGQIKQPNLTYASPSVVAARYNEAMNSYRRGEIDELTLLDKLYNDVQKDAAGRDVNENTRAKIDIYGINEDYIGDKLETLREAVKDAENKLSDSDKAIALLSKEYGITEEFIKDMYGDDDDDEPIIPTYHDDLEAAKRAYLEAKAEKERIEANPSQYTTEARNAAIQAYEDAKDKYEKLGGSTKDADENAASEAAKKAKELAEAQLKLERDLEQKRIDQLAEGGEKERAQIALNYQLREDEIKRQEDALEEKQGGTLTQEQEQSFAQLRAYNVAQQAKEIEALVAAERRAMNEYLSEYGEYQEKRLAITELYGERIAKATNEWERKGLEKERDVALKELDESMMEKSDLWLRLFNDADKMSNAQLKSVIADTKKLLGYLRGASDVKPIGFTDEQLEQLKGNVEEIGEIYKALYEKQEELDARNQYPFSNIINAFKKLKEARELDIKAANEQDEAQKRIMLETSLGLKQQAKDLALVSATSAAETLIEVTDAMKQLAEVTGNDSLKESAEQLGAMAQNIGAAAQGAATGGWIGAIVGGVTDMISQTFEAIVGVEAEQREFEQNRMDFLTEYKKLLLELKDEDYESVFGSKNLKKASDTWKNMIELERLYKEATEGALEEFDGKKKKTTNAGVATFLSPFAWAIKDTTAEYKAYLEAVEKGYNALEGMQVKTLDRSGWANFWGAQDEYTSLKDLAPELWDEDGAFNVDAARKFLETNTQITDEQRKQIQNVIDLKDMYEEALDAIDSMIADVFGQLSSDLTDIIFDSVRNGTDAWDAFGEKGSEIIDKLGKQMIQELYVQAYLDQYQDDLREAFASGDSNKIAEVTNDIFDNMGSLIEGASAAAAAWDSNAEAMGFDMDTISQTATAKGFQVMSQDTGDELNGRFTDIQGKTSAINDAVQYIKSLSISQLQHASSISETLAQIHNDTFLIERHTRELSQIRSGIDRINKNLENL